MMGLVFPSSPTGPHKVTGSAPALSSLNSAKISQLKASEGLLARKTTRNPLAGMLATPPWNRKRSVSAGCTAVSERPKFLAKLSVLSGSVSAPLL